MNAAHASIPLRFALPAAAAYGLAIYAALPAGVVACNDDFGYLKSVVQTLQHGRPWTDDWLEPWSASLSVLAAGLYLLLGHFPLAVHGLLAGLAAVSFLGAATLFHARGLRPPATLAAAAGLLTFPVLLWKTLEFTGVALYLPCLLWALWAAERKRWLLFGIAWAIAVASRQSAVAWLALPAVDLARHAIWRSPPGVPGWRGPAVVLAFAAPWLALLAGGMNPSHAQVVRTGAILWRANTADGLAAVAAGLAVFALSAGIGAWAIGLGDSGRLRTWSRALLLPGATLAVAVAAVDFRALLHWDVVSFGDPAGFFYGKLILAAAAAGWVLVRIRLDPGPAVLAFASLVLLGVRGDRYDYYFADIALAAFFCLRAPAGAPPVPEPAPARVAHAAWARVVVGLGLLAAGSFHARFGHGLKLTLDRAWALCSLYEHALRAGKIQPGELRDAPFGYLGWHLHPLAAASGGDNFRRFAGLGRRAPTVVWEIAPPSPSLTPAGTLADETHRLGSVGRHRFILRRIAPAEAGDALVLGPRHVPFPLDAAEWTQLIAGPPLPNAGPR